MKNENKDFGDLPKDSIEDVIKFIFGDQAEAKKNPLNMDNVIAVDLRDLNSKLSKRLRLDNPEDLDAIDAFLSGNKESKTFVEDNLYKSFRTGASGRATSPRSNSVPVNVIGFPGGRNLEILAPGLIKSTIKVTFDKAQNVLRVVGNAGRKENTLGSSIHDRTQFTNKDLDLSLKLNFPLLDHSARASYEAGIVVVKLKEGPKEEKSQFVEIVVK